MLIVAMVDLVIKLATKQNRRTNLELRVPSMRIDRKILQVIDDPCVIDFINPQITASIPLGCYMVFQWKEITARICLRRNN
jgi:hypothetical protein